MDLLFTTECNLTTEEILSIIREEVDYEITPEMEYDEITRFLNTEIEIQEELLMEEIRKMEQHTNASKYLIEANIGTWMGARQAGAVVNSLKQAIMKCANGLEDYSVSEEDGVIIVKGSHHDGSNSFKIRPLSKKGWEYYDRHEYDSSMSDWELIQKLSEEKSYTKKIRRN